MNISPTASSMIDPVANSQHLLTINRQHFLSSHLHLPSTHSQSLHYPSTHLLVLHHIFTSITFITFNAYPPSTLSSNTCLISFLLQETPNVKNSYPIITFLSLAWPSNSLLTITSHLSCALQAFPAGGTDRLTASTRNPPIAWAS